jgi:hypothetical protein
VAVLLGLHLALALGSARFHSPTHDEPIHLAAGIAYWSFNEYYLQPENGNLPQRWAGAGALIFDKVNFPPRDQPGWRESDVWNIAQEVLYRSNNDADRLLFHGRSGIALASAALCLVVYLWSRAAWGPAGALVSLVAAAFCPNLIAHGHLTTSDLFAALFFTGSAWQIGRNLERVTLGRTLSAGVWVAGLFLSKFSAPLIVPVAGLICAARLARRVPLEFDISRRWRGTITGLGAQIGVLPCLAAAYAAICWIAIWAAFGFRYAAADAPVRGVEFYELKSVETACQSLGAAGAVIGWTARHRLLPEAYLYGAAFVAAHSQPAAWWNGHYSSSGWPGFFPYCWLVKTPLPTLALAALAATAWLASFLRSSPGSRSRMILASVVAPAFALLLVYWPSAILSTRNLGHRHILPTYPAMFVLFGAVALAFDARRVRYLTAGLLAWLAADCALAFPNYIAYFNSVIGTKHGYRHLVDSSLDWGQDLPQLKTWLDARQRREPAPGPVYLAYFGQSDPQHYGIEAHDLLASAPLPVQYEPGLYCISATMLAGVYDIPAPWNAASEGGYRATRQTLGEYFARPAEELEAALRQRDPRLMRAIRNFNLWQLGRLMAFLRHREPTANVGGSILIFDLHQSALDTALNGPVPE